MPQAVLFGAVGTLAETSDLQRRAFEAAFAEAGLDWRWPESLYRDLLTTPGGQARIARYAAERGETVDAAALHRRKTEIFQEMLGALDLPLRAGVAETIAAARARGLRIGLCTATAPENVGRMLAALHPPLGADSFDVVTTAGDGVAAKPDPACYRLALDRLGLAAGACVAVEDTPESAAAASAAGIPCLAFPGLYHAGRGFPGTIGETDALSPGVLGLAVAGGAEGTA
jgi:HAD superfamily hydrolase (TIGR01509 family)